MGKWNLRDFGQLVPNHMAAKIIETNVKVSGTAAKGVVER